METGKLECRGDMRRTILATGLATMAIYAAIMALPTDSWASVDLVNGQGATAPCIGIGPIAEPLVEKCAKGFEQGGFIRDDQVGVSGLTIGEGGVVSGVAAASPAAKA